MPAKRQPRRREIRAMYAGALAAGLREDTSPLSVHVWEDDQRLFIVETGREWGIVWRHRRRHPYREFFAGAEIAALLQQHPCGLKARVLRLALARPDMPPALVDIVHATDTRSAALAALATVLE